MGRALRLQAHRPILVNLRRELTVWPKAARVQVTNRAPRRPAVDIGIILLFEAGVAIILRQGPNPTNVSPLRPVYGAMKDGTVDERGNLRIHVFTPTIETEEP